MHVDSFTKLDSLLQAALEDVAPAIVCRIESRNKVIFDAAYGTVISNGEQVPTTSQTLFDLASLTKLFTATACLLLAADEKLPLDDRVVQYVQGFGGSRRVGPTLDPVTKSPVPISQYWSYAPLVDADNITIRQLLTHSSGLPAWSNLFDACGPVPAPGYALSTAEISSRQAKGIAKICQTDFAYPTGQSYVYSDLGLILLGEVVTRASGHHRLDQALLYLLKDIGLNVRFNPQPTTAATTSSADVAIAPTELCSWRQRRLIGEVHDENAAGLGGIAGHAGLFGAATDLCTLGRIYLDRGGGYLPAGLVDEALTCNIAAIDPGAPLPNPDEPCAVENPAFRRGLGWMLKTHESSCGPLWSESSFGHTGYTGTSIWCDPKSQCIAVLLTNRVHYGRDPDPIYRLRIDVHNEVARILQSPR